MNLKPKQGDLFLLKDALGIGDLVLYFVIAVGFGSLTVLRFNGRRAATKHQVGSAYFSSGFYKKIKR